jgi:hypothetical protein
MSQALMPSSPVTIQTSGGNLFALAAQYYGDATMWWWIAQYNGLTDPMLPAGQFTITIPPYDAGATGGLLPQ